jgi:hypothetical protein
MRFQTVPEAEALTDAFELEEEDPEESEPSEPGDGGDSDNPTAGSGETVLHLYCPHCGEKIF